MKANFNGIFAGPEVETEKKKANWKGFFQNIFFFIFILPFLPLLLLLPHYRSNPNKRRDIWQMWKLYWVVALAVAVVVHYAILTKNNHG